MSTTAEHDVQGILASFGETCTYIPKNGDARSVVAVVDEESHDQDQASGLDRKQRLHVFVSRDSIPDPQLGDAFCREDDHDAEGNPDPKKCYSYEGTKTQGDRVGWTLEFVRKSPLERGGHRMQR